MEQFYSNDSLKAFNTEDGILIQESKKGMYKMIIVTFGLGLLVLIAGFLVGVFGSSLGMIMAPWLIWGALIVIGITTIAFIIKLITNADPTIVFNTKKRELTVRGKVIPFSDIESIITQEQPFMGKTIVIAFMLINGKKKSLFSTGLTIADPKAMTGFIGNLNELVQKGNLSNAVINEMDEE